MVHVIMRAVLVLAIWTCLLVVDETSAQRTINMLHFGWLSTAGEYQYLSNPDVGTSTWIVSMAVKHFNERYGGVLPVFGTLQSCDVQIRLIGNTVRDDRGLSSIAMKDFIGLRASNRIDIIHGSIRSDVSIPLAVTAGTLQIPQISHFSTSESLTDKELYPRFFRTVPSDAQRAQAVANLFQQWGYKKVGMIYVNEAFGLGWRTGLARECLQRGIRLIAVSYESSARGAVLDEQVRRGLKNLIDERINVIMHISLIADFLYSFSRVVTELNWVKGKLFIGHSNYFQRILDLRSDSNRILQAMNGSLLILPTVEENPNWANLRSHWRQINTTEMEPLFPNTLMRDGKRFHLPPDYFQNGQERERFNSWAYAYDSVAAVGLAACSSRTRVLAESMKTVNFEGTSGKVQFDDRQNREQSTVDFSLINLVMPPSNVIVTAREVAVTRAGGNWTFKGEIVFSDGSSTYPVDVDPPTHVIDTLPVGLRALGWIEAALAMILGLGALIYLKNKEKDKIIIESQPVFMMLLASGCTLMGASIVPLTVDSSVGCMLFPWLFALGFTIILAALGAKSVRVAILWYHRGPIRVRRKAARAKVLLTGVAIVLVVEMIILIAWQVVAPLEYTLNTSQRDNDGNPLYSSGTCASLTHASTVFFALLVVYVCVVVFITMWISFWVRNAPEKYHETKMSAVAAISIFQVFFVGVPSAVVVWNMPVPRFLVLSSITFLICLVVLGTMFFPKVFKAYLSSMQSSSDKDHVGESNVAGPSRDMAGGQARGGDGGHPMNEMVRSEVKAIRSAADYENLPAHQDSTLDSTAQSREGGVLRTGLFLRRGGSKRSGDSGLAQNGAQQRQLYQSSSHVEPESLGEGGPIINRAKQTTVSFSSHSSTYEDDQGLRRRVPTASDAYSTTRSDPSLLTTMAMANANASSQVNENGQDASSSSSNRKVANTTPSDTMTSDCSRVETYEQEEEYPPGRGIPETTIVATESTASPEGKALQLT